MKFRLYATLFGLSAAAFAACNNGDYDAQPSADGSSIQNPLNPDLPAAKGTLKARIDGQFYTFPFAGFFRQDSTLQIAAAYRLPGETSRFIGFGLRPFKGVGTYALLDTGGNISYSSASYTTFYEQDTSGSIDIDSTSLKIYNTRWEPKRGEGQWKVELSNAGEIKGTFNFTAYREFPASADDKVVITDGSFWVTPE